MFASPLGMQTGKGQQDHTSAVASSEGIAGFIWSLAKLGSWAHVKGPHAYSFPVPTRKGAPVVATSVFLLRTSCSRF